MPPRIPDTTRAAILADIRAGQLGNRKIATKHGVSPSTVTKIAKDEGVTGAFERSNTENATRATVADSRSRRAALAAALLDDADRLRQRAWSSYTYYERGQQGPELVTLEQPPLKEVKEAYVAVGIAIDKHAMLEKHDSGANEAATSLLSAVAESLHQAYSDVSGKNAGRASD